MTEPVDLAAVARELLPHLPWTSGHRINRLAQQVAKVAEEGHEVSDAWWHEGNDDRVMEEAADTVIAVHVLAELMGADLDAAVRAKLPVLEKRYGVTLTEMHGAGDGTR